jgi:hypothetical protein
MTTEWGGDPDLNAALNPLRERFTGWRFWVGGVTRNVWAMPPARHPHRDLVCADTPAALSDKVAALESRRES